jgi:hypothetical protein
MAFRIETRIGAVLALAAVTASGQMVMVRHKHARHGTTGELRVSGDGILFSETGKHQKHSRSWKYEDIQQLELSPGILKILTYEDRNWKMGGRDREYTFDGLPEGFAQEMYQLWRGRLDQRFVADLADETIAPVWRVPAKLLGAIRGSEGFVLFGNDAIVYKTSRPEQSRTWRFSDIENVATAGPFDFSIVTREHHGNWNVGSREFRFQLKEALPESRYNELWRKLNLSKQSELIRTSLQARE